MTGTMHELHANLGVDKKSLPDKLKTQKGGLGKSQENKKGKTIRGVLSKVLSQNPNCKSLQSRFEMTHGRVSSSQTLIYPLLPLPSQSIFIFFKKKTTKTPKQKPPLSQRKEQCKQHMHEIYQALGWAIMMSRKKQKDNQSSAYAPQRNQKNQKII